MPLCTKRANSLGGWGVETVSPSTYREIMRENSCIPQNHVITSTMLQDWTNTD